MENKGLALAVCIALTSPTIVVAETFSGIAALNLGEIKSSSYLDERFKGSIPILYTSANEASQLKVRLASDAVFRELGVEKLSILNSLSFHIEIRGNGKPYVAIRSTQAINLAFLSFVVEIYGTEGSIYQDYTVLLDPRSYVSNNIISTPAVVENTNQQSRLVNKIRPKRVRVKAGNSLSGIANSVKLPNISNKKMARAIFLKNPRAFSGNNVNKLKEGVTLKIPTLKEIKNLKPAVKKIAQKKTSTTEQITIEKPIKTSDEGSLSYKVKSGDTLSGISRKYVSNAGSFSKMMAEIHAENPHAFTDNKINLLKKGAILTISTGESLDKASIQQPDKQESIVENEPNKNAQEIELNTYKVIQGDTLGLIVKRLGYSRSDSARVMKSIYRKNKKAFNNNDITSIKSGATLHLLNKGDAKKLLETQKKPLKATPSVESTIINSLNSLEKRLRELRKELKTSQSKLFDLNLTLKNKDALLERQSKDIKILKKKLADVEAKSLEKNAEKPAPVIKSTEKNISTDAIEETVENEISTAEMITYSGLVFLVGFLLLRVGRQKYAERMVAADDYVPRAKIDPQLAQGTLDFNKTLVSSAKENSGEINEASIQECERLVEELVDELDYKLASTHDDNQTETSANNQYVETLQEELQKVSSNDNLVSESVDNKTEKESNVLKADILSSLEKSVEEKVELEYKAPNEGNNSREDLVTLEIDLERHLQSINDQIVANKMKDII